MECWHFAEVTSSGQPILRENEKDILIDQMVGLYHNKSKILNRQRGRIFLTSQRVIYVDDVKPTKNSLSLELSGIESLQFSSRFLRRSARLILFIKRVDDSQVIGPDGRALTSQENCTSTWVCPICMVTNETDGEFTEDTKPRPVCANCGVAADYEMTKESISISHSHDYQDGTRKTSNTEDNVNQCPCCTFINHFQITNCEICGTRLPNSKIRHDSNRKPGFKDSRVHFVLEHPISSNQNSEDDPTDFVQISFRKSDGVLFTQATEKILEDLKKNELNIVYNKDLVSVNGVKVKDDSLTELPLLETKLRKIGITSLEESGENQLLNNDIIFNNALTDLNSLMSLANDIEKLYTGSSAKMLGDKREGHKPLLILDREKFCNKSVFLDEIAREIYGFAVSEFKAEEEKLGSVMITLVDLYAMYNKCMRIGTGLISPQEMREACERFEQLGLRDLKLTKVNGRVLCLASKNSFEFVKTKILEIVHTNIGCDLLLLTQLLNVVSSNTWTIGIIMEVLQNCIDQGDLVIDEQVSGIHYYRNEYWPVNTMK
ncbi:VPS36 (YLR417W) [Zygosaccharomyces parabailii]|nr:VPS36 (YLR417W) [Zygosaccharomyces parabailii]SJM86822.1 related to Vacuolar protein-sorting-associated protein 36 [Zygosaccharomyces bailii]